MTLIDDCILHSLSNQLPPDARCCVKATVEHDIRIPLENPSEPKITYTVTILYGEYCRCGLSHESARDAMEQAIAEYSEWRSFQSYKNRMIEGVSHAQ